MSVDCSMHEKSFDCPMHEKTKEKRDNQSNDGVNKEGVGPTYHHYFGEFFGHKSVINSECGVDSDFNVGINSGGSCPISGSGLSNVPLGFGDSQHFAFSNGGGLCSNKSDGPPLRSKAVRKNSGQKGQPKGASGPRSGEPVAKKKEKNGGAVALSSRQFCIFWVWF
ncbi:hypothetical protein Hanom_Chr10g00950991 [Helianthus anomalus]